MELLGEIGKQYGPLVGMAVVLGIMIGRATNKIINRHLDQVDNLGKGLDQVRERLHKMASRIQEHSEADAEVVAAIAELGGRLSGLLEAMEQFTPTRALLPEARARYRNSDDEETPPVGNRRAAPARPPTPRPGSYGPLGRAVRRRTDSDDPGDSGDSSGG